MFLIKVSVSHISDSFKIIKNFSKHKTNDLAKIKQVVYKTSIGFSYLKLKLYYYVIINIIGFQLQLSSLLGKS